MDSTSLAQPGQQIKPNVTLEMAKEMASKLYGLRVKEIHELNAYDDRNFHILVDDIESKTIKRTWVHGYVLKIMNSLDSKNLLLIDGQKEILIFLTKYKIICPNPVPNLQGFFYSLEEIPNGPEKSNHMVRLLEYQPGTILYHIPCTKEILFETGRYVANLDNILKGFSHSAYKSYKSLWSLESVPNLTKFMFAVKDEDKARMAAEVIEVFNKEVIPILNKLEKGMIHGDFNEQNILCENCEDGWHISGILDFGDSHYSCYIFELAITICYMMLQSKDMDPLEASGYVLAGYSAVRKLPEVEYKLLKICVAARFCQSLVLGAYSYSLNPTNDYVMITAKLGWKHLHYLWNTPSESIHCKWEEIKETMNV
ncbi:hypothetical protein J437_LFUL009100 [Ladona fulva]|uniref:Hydroxylysine kinase n=1 Tax=Ladona fulva TaxID=123851 RepID=A0A8K0K6J4_LADFU|nr:hypothetical protein J437_LFUL009100 [Ladona fulva]